MGIKLADVFVLLGADNKQLTKDLDGAEKQTKTWADSLGGMLKKALPAVTVAAIGKAIWDVGQKFDEATDTIAIKTGSTGEALDGLTDDFKRVFTSIPTEAGPAAEVISELNRRLGLTGTELTDLSKPLLEMTRILGGDAATNAALFTRVMGDWGISAEDAASVLDKMFVASQKTGVGVESLMQKVVQFGAPLRLMGFSLDESVAMFAKWEKEGVNSELVMGSLRIAAGKFAADNIPLQQGLQDTITKIQGMTDSSAALALGMDVFGARAGPDMVAAIREGRFNIEDLTAALQGADGAIMQTASDTADFGEKATIFKNKIVTELAPVGLALLDVATKAMDWLLPKTDEAFTGVQTVITTVSSKVREALDTDFSWIVTFWNTTLADIRKKGEEVWEDIQEFITGFVDTVKPYVTEWLQNARDLFQRVWPEIQTIVKTAIELIQEVITRVLTFLKNFWDEHGKQILSIVTTAFDSIRTVIETVIGVVKGILQTALALIRGDWEGAWGYMKTTLETLWEGIKTIVSNAVTILKTGLSIAWDEISEKATTIWNAISTKVSEVWESIKTAISTKVGDIKTLVETKFNEIKAWIGGLPGAFTQLGIDIISGLWNGMMGKFNEAKSWIENQINALVNGLKDLLDSHSPSGVFYDIGVDMWQGVIDATADASGPLVDFVGSVGSAMAKRVKDEVAVAVFNMTDGVRQLKTLAEEWNAWVNYGEVVPGEITPGAGTGGNDFGPTDGGVSGHTGLNTGNFGPTAWVDLVRKAFAGNLPTISGHTGLGTGGSNVGVDDWNAWVNYGEPIPGEGGLFKPTLAKRSMGGRDEPAAGGGGSRGGGGGGGGSSAGLDELINLLTLLIRAFGEFLDAQGWATDVDDIARELEMKRRLRYAS